MPVPATIGSLKTKIEDMQIGDYIICKYAAASGTVGSFIELGTTAATEIATTGSATPNGSFYFIKIDKGLLIADRVVQHTFAWDAMNTGKIIQGLPLDAGNIIPTMTSNTSPSGVASASSILNGNVAFDAWKAFNKVTTGSEGWGINGGAGWLQYDFGAGNEKVINRYSITSPTEGVLIPPGGQPKTWTFQGSNDGVLWTDLDNRPSEIAWGTAAIKRTYPINNKTAYRYYRLNVTANNGAVQSGIAELEMFYTIGTIRSLTGGVAYADTNGDKSLTKLDFGGWPTNNEWDKYIINFPIDKIQSGKTINDIFHCENSGFTWCQETPVNTLFNISNNSPNRIIRGGYNTYIDSKYLSYGASSTTYSTGGFRPVFEYKEV